MSDEIIIGSGDFPTGMYTLRFPARTPARIVGGFVREGEEDVSIPLKQVEEIFNREVRNRKLRPFINLIRNGLLLLGAILSNSVMHIFVWEQWMTFLLPVLFIVLFVRDYTLLDKREVPFLVRLKGGKSFTATTNGLSFSRFIKALAEEKSGR